MLFRSERRHTREIAQYGGLKLIVPFMATMFLIATLSSVAVPFFNGFVGEFTILQGSFISAKAGMMPTAFAATGMILSAVYMLWWFQRIMLGPVTQPVNKHLPDLSRSEWLVLTPLVIMIFWIGLGSPYWLSKMEAPVATLLPHEAELIDPALPISTVISQGGVNLPLTKEKEPTHTHADTPVPKVETPKPVETTPPANNGTAGNTATPSTGETKPTTGTETKEAETSNGKEAEKKADKKEAS